MSAELEARHHERALSAAIDCLMEGMLFSQQVGIVQQMRQSTQQEYVTLLRNSAGDEFERALSAYFRTLADQGIVLQPVEDGRS